MSLPRQGVLKVPSVRIKSEDAIHDAACAYGWRIDWISSDRVRWRNATGLMVEVEFSRLRVAYRAYCGTGYVDGKDKAAQVVTYMKEHAS